ncbi:uncharacterized protein LOC131445815 [Solea solea]|uniref:uncharacterized protein LOC131445815 n=1 Tax=Solea solea TaxID=90069 RepID=UPI00272CB48B|nr:uncharacterized protein LOC131445815 [Solea solea]
MDRNRPWHPFRHPGLCGIRGTMCCFLFLTLIIVLPILFFLGPQLIPHSLDANTSNTNQLVHHLKRTLLTNDSLHDHAQNVWYQTMFLFARQQTTSPCYVCSLIPRTATGSVPVVPRPLNATETLSVLVAMTTTAVDAVDNSWITVNMTRRLEMINETLVDYTGLKWRFNLSSLTPDSRQTRLSAPIFHTQLAPWKPKVCFRRNCISPLNGCAPNVPVGSSAHCEQIVNAGCGVRSCGDPCPNTDSVPFVGRANLTGIPTKTNSSVTNPYVRLPNPTTWCQYSEIACVGLWKVCLSFPPSTLVWSLLSS